MKVAALRAMSFEASTKSQNRAKPFGESALRALFGTRYIDGDHADLVRYLLRTTGANLIPDNPDRALGTLASLAGGTNDGLLRRALRVIDRTERHDIECLAHLVYRASSLNVPARLELFREMGMTFSASMLNDDMTNPVQKIVRSYNHKNTSYPGHNIAEMLYELDPNWPIEEPLTTAIDEDKDEPAAAIIDVFVEEEPPVELKEALTTVMPATIDQILQVQDDPDLGRAAKIVVENSLAEDQKGHAALRSFEVLFRHGLTFDCDGFDAIIEALHSIRTDSGRGLARNERSDDEVGGPFGPCHAIGVKEALKTIFRDATKYRTAPPEVLKQTADKFDMDPASLTDSLTRRQQQALDQLTDA